MVEPTNFTATRELDVWSHGHRLRPHGVAMLLDSRIWASVTDSTALLRHGWGVGAEMGYDIAPRSTVSLTPFVQYSYVSVGDIYYPLGSGIPWARGWKHQIVSLGLGVTLHERRPRE